MLQYSLSACSSVLSDSPDSGQVYLQFSPQSDATCSGSGAGTGRPRGWRRGRRCVWAASLRSRSADRRRTPRRPAADTDRARDARTRRCDALPTGERTQRQRRRSERRDEPPRETCPARRRCREASAPALQKSHRDCRSPDNCPDPPSARGSDAAPGSQSSHNKC